MHLGKDDLAEIKRILARNLPPGAQVFAFGSRVHGRNLKPYSDLDLCLRWNAQIPPDVMTKLGTEFEDSRLPFKVDVIDWAAISPEFKDAISADLEFLT
jgi:predicted nucleotidyltransferase